MKNESVAILDIRSNEISFLLGSNGVNGTFVFKGACSEKYSGFSTTSLQIIEKESFQRAITKVIDVVRKNYVGTIKEIFVGVPSWAVSVRTKGQTNSYPSKRKISSQDVDALYASGLNELTSFGKCIRYSNMYFALGDNRKYFSVGDIYGISTTMLNGGLSYYFIDETFYATTDALLRSLGFLDVYYVPSTLAQAQYLFSEKQREGYAFLLDIGYAASSISVVYGNGIVHEETFPFGIVTIIDGLKNKFDVSSVIAEEMLAAASVSGGSSYEDVPWYGENEEISYSIKEINEQVKCTLDVLCEDVAKFFDKHYKEKNVMSLTVNPIGITGDGIGYIKGVGEHVSKQLNMLTEIVAPDLPYYDKTVYSSRISLLDIALLDKNKQSWIYKIFNIIGGKRK